MDVQRRRTTGETFGNPRRRWMALIALVTVAGGVSVTCPRPARADIFTPGVSEQIKMGDQAAAQVEQQYPVIHDSRAAHLQEVGDRLLQALGTSRGPWHWSFSLVNSKEINAFALPGGHVFMFTGLYDRLTNDSEIAAVLGHEMTHVREQHWAHEYAAQQKRDLGLSLLLGLTHAGSGWQTVAGLGDTLLNLKYSRGEEEKADIGGLQNMVAAGYNPNGMLQLFQVLSSAQHGGSMPEFLSDHPLNSHRIAAARAAIRRMGYPVTVG